MLFGVVLGLCSLPGLAQKPPDVTAGEVARLPAYCPHSQSFAGGGFPEGPLPGQKPWIAKMGHGFWAVHHYCWAIINANRAAATAELRTREYLLSKAIEYCNYVVRNTSADFVLLPEIYLRMGEYHDRLDQPAAALLHFERALGSKPDYWPAYLRMADLQAKLGKHSAAVKALTDGLKHSPQQPQLQAALARLGKRDSGKDAGNHSSPPALGASSGPK